VNTSGQFVGVAEMVGPVDLDKTGVLATRQVEWLFSTQVAHSQGCAQQHLEAYYAG